MDGLAWEITGDPAPDTPVDRASRRGSDGAKASASASGGTSPPDKQAMVTFSQPGAFNPASCGSMTTRSCGRCWTTSTGTVTGPFGSFEWQIVLAYPGAREAEIVDVQKRLGWIWR